jgi:cell wall assembly regulator SMI1
MAQIVAIVTTDREKVGGGAPIFIVKDEAERQKVAFSLEKMLDCIAQDLNNGIMILVKHSKE